MAKRRRIVTSDPCLRRTFEREYRELLDLNPGVAPSPRVRKNLVQYALFMAKQQCGYKGSRR